MAAGPAGRGGGAVEPLVAVVPDEEFDECDDEEQAANVTMAATAQTKAERVVDNIRGVSHSLRSCDNFRELSRRNVARTGRTAPLAGRRLVSLRLLREYS